MLMKEPGATSRTPTASVTTDLGFEDDVDRLRLAIEQWVDGTSEEMQEVLRWQFLGGSKYFRPLTIFSCYRAVYGREIPELVIRSAMAVELIHNMSLIIDDILDRSRQRRNKLTLHCRFGNLRALMAAGYIVADGYQQTIDDKYTIGLLSELVKRLGVAECVQWRLRRQPLGVEDWRMIAGEDTGSMFEVCAGLGARTDRLRRFGQLLGLLYHGCDDVADVRGGRALGGGGREDLRDRILTLPAALAIRDPRVAEMFVNPLPDGEQALAQAFESQLPEAERYLDQIGDEANREAQLFAANADGLIALVEQTRRLSTS